MVSVRTGYIVTQKLDGGGTLEHWYWDTDTSHNSTKVAVLILSDSHSSLDNFFSVIFHIF